MILKESSPQLVKQVQSYLVPKSMKKKIANQSVIHGLARLTPARPDRNGNGPVLLIFSPFCSLVSLLMPAQCLLVCTRILKETWRNICLDWKKTGSRGKAGQNVVHVHLVQKNSFKFPSNYWHDTRSMPAIFFAVSNLVQSSRYQAGVIWLQSSQSITTNAFSRSY